MNANLNQAVMPRWKGTATATEAMLAVIATFAAATIACSAPSPVIVLPSGVAGVQIQQALDRLPKGGGEVVLPPETIVIRQPIVLQHDHLTLRGSGNGTVLRLADGANCPVLILGEPVNHPRHTVSHLLVADLCVDGNRRQQQRELWRISGEGSQIRNNGITIQRVTDSMVTNVTCADCRSVDWSQHWA